MIEDVISNDCDISETFINSANIAPNNIDRQIDMQLYQTVLYYTITI